MIFADEAQLQKLLYESPELIPTKTEDQAAVFTREAGLPGSGFTDLVGVDAQGNILIVEFRNCSVHLNFEHKNHDLVGLGSYIVNAVGDCNGCHSPGPPTEFASAAGNPYFLSPPFTGKEEINLSTYLGGGRDFGPLGSVVHLYSRNLTPDNTGLPVEGTINP